MSRYDNNYDDDMLHYTSRCILIVQLRKGISLTGQDEEREAQDACQETHSAPDIRRSPQGNTGRHSDQGCHIVGGIKNTEGAGASRLADITPPRT